MSWFYLFGSEYLPAHHAVIEARDGQIMHDMVFRGPLLIRLQRGSFLHNCLLEGYVRVEVDRHNWENPIPGTVTACTYNTKPTAFG